DFYLKKGVRLGELLLDPEAAVASAVEWANLRIVNIYGEEPVTVAETVAWAKEHLARIGDRVRDTSTLLHDAVHAGQEVLLEAQLGALRDIHFGIYPYTTSSCCLAEFAPIGAGLFGHGVDRVVGVMKAFSTCVGEGPFVSSMDDAEASALRETAKEYGATTGRPRSIGHFDAVASRYGVRVQGATEVAITKLDSLSGRKSLKICTAYRVDGVASTEFPLTSLLSKAEPVYETHPGWEEDVTDCRRFEDLPATARAYVERIEALIGCAIRFVSVGPERDQLIVR